MATSLPPVSQSFDADATAYVAAIDAMMEKNQQLARSAVEAVAEINAALEAIGDKSIGLTLNTAELEAQIEEVKTEIDAVGDAAIPVSLDTTRLLAQIEQVKTEIDALGAAEIPVTLDEDTILEQIGYIRELLADIPPVTINISLDGGAAILAELAAIRAAMDGLKADNISTSLNTAAAAVDATSAAMTRASSASSTYHSWWGVLQHDVQLWGGALASTDTTLVSHVATWHIVLDELLEATIAVTGAVIALSAAFAALYPTAQDVYTHLQAVNVVSSATGETIAPLTGKFKELQDALQPQGIELYGSALSALGGGDMVALGTAIAGVVSLLDKWGAEIDVWVGKSNGMSGAIEKGNGYLQQLGSLIADIVLAVQNLMAAEPGVAHFVLDFVDGFAKAIDVITGFSPALDTVVLAVHGLMLWGGLAVSMFANMAVGILKPVSALASLVAGTKSATAAIEDFELVNDAAATPVQKLQLTLSSMGTAFTNLGSGLKATWSNLTADVTSAAVSMDAAAAEMATLAEEGGVLDAEFAALTGEIRASSAALMAMDGELTVATGGMNLVVGAIAVLSAAFVGVILYASQAKTATQQWADSLEQSVNQARGLDQIGQTYSALGQVTTALSSAQKNLSSALTDTSNKVQPTRMRLEGGYTPAVQAAAQTVGTLSAAQKQLSTDFGTEVGNVQQIASTYKVGYVQAAMLAADAGVSLTTSLKGNSSEAQIARQKIQNYVTGLTGMTSPMNNLGADVNAVTIATGLQQSKVQQLTQAWSTVMSVVQGPSNGFLSIAQSLDQFNSDAATAGARMTGLGTAAATTTRNVTDASTKLQGDFNNTVTAMQGYTNSMMTAAAITGNQGPMVQGIKDEIAILLPMAGSNASAAAQIKVLWQEAGGSASDSLSQIGTAVSGIKSPLQNLQQISGQTALSLANLGQDAQNLANTITSSLNQTLVAQAQQLEGVSAKAGTYLQVLKQFGPNSAQAQAALANMNDATSKATQLATEAASGVTALSGAQSKYGSTLNAEAANRTKFNNDLATIISKAPGSTTDINNLAKSIQSSGSQISTTASERTQLIADLEKSGVNAQTATKDVDNWITSLQKLGSSVGPIITSVDQLGAAIQNLPSSKTITIVEQGVSYGISAGGAASPHAAGYLVPGYGGGDRHLALLEGGESVVPKELTPSVAPFLKAHGVPGFASGAANVANRAAAAAQDAAMLARLFPAAPIPPPAPAPPEFMGDWLPSALTGIGAAHATAPGGGSGAGGGTVTLEAQHPVQIQVNLDGKQVWRSEQRHTLRYNLRNNGIATGLQKPRLPRHFNRVSLCYTLARRARIILAEILLCSGFSQYMGSRPRPVPGCAGWSHAGYVHVRFGVQFLSG